jgi:hypothetical protein
MISSFARLTISLLACTTAFLLEAYICENAVAQTSGPSSMLAQASSRLTSPEAAVREFLLASVFGEKDRINNCTLNVPGREILTENSGDAPPAEARQEIENQLKNLPLTRLKVGERISLPGDKSLTITADMVNENRQQLTGPEIPFPFVVVKEGEQWKVDPTPIIAARRAARPSQTQPATSLVVPPSNK